MKIISVIPARLQATRFPKKLLKPLGNQSVISMTYLNTQHTNLFDDVFVVTDSDAIEKEIQQIGGKVIRSKKEHETGSDRIAEVVADLDCNVVINVQGDEPFTKTATLQPLVDVFKNDSEQQIDVASLKVELLEEEEIQNPNNVKVITDVDDFAIYFSRSVIPYHRNETFKPKYYKHVGIYAFRKEALMQFSNNPMLQNEQAEKIEAIRFLEYGMKMKMLETKETSFGIDTPEDLIKANQYLKQNPEILVNLGI